MGGGVRDLPCCCIAPGPKDWGPGRMILEGTGCLQSSRLLHTLTSRLVCACISTSLVMAATVPSVEGFLLGGGTVCGGCGVKV